MATVGSFVVNTYMNNDNFMAGVKASQSAAKKMETGIGSSMDKINEKQLGNFGKSLMKGVGVVSMLDAGLKMGADLIKGFNDGSINSIGGAFSTIGDALLESIKSIPVAGSAFLLGQALRKGIIAGIEKMYNTKTDETKHNENTPSDEWAASWEKNAAKVKVSIDLVKKTLQSIEQITQTQFDADLDRSSALDQIDKNRLKYIEKLTEAYKKANNAQRDKDYLAGGANPNADKIEQDFEQREIFNATDIEYARLKAKLSDDAFKAEQIRLGFQSTGENAINDLIKKRHEMNMSERDLLAEILAESVAHAGITQDQADSALKDFDALKKNAEDRAAAEKKISDELKAQNDQLKAQEEFDKTKASLEEEVANLSSTTGVSSAIGDVKVAGAADFSIEKQLSLAQEALQAANDSVELLRTIADQAKNAGATT